jgi:hypothetical protein
MIKNSYGGCTDPPLFIAIGSQIENEPADHHDLTNFSLDVQVP